MPAAKKSTLVPKSSKSKKSAVNKTASGPAAKKTGATRASAKSENTKPEKDPKGGLTSEGRKAFARKEGSHLRPGVQGPADTPEKMRRKGSFQRRHFAHPRGPMQRDGKPTRLALSAHAWGEPVPKTEADARKLAAKGHKLLEKYHRTAATKSAKKKSAARKS
jgi:hypothetical protein